MANKKSDGGSAFPELDKNVHGDGYYQTNRLTKREYYKAAAIRGLLLNQFTERCSDRKDIAETAGRIADALIEEDLQFNKEP